MPFTFPFWLTSGRESRRTFLGPVTLGFLRFVFRAFLGKAERKRQFAYSDLCPWIAHRSLLLPTMGSIPWLFPAFTGPQPFYEPLWLLMAPLPSAFAF